MLFACRGPSRESHGPLENCGVKTSPATAGTHSGKEAEVRSNFDDVAAKRGRPREQVMEPGAPVGFMEATGPDSRTLRFGTQVKEKARFLEI